MYNGTAIRTTATTVANFSRSATKAIIYYQVTDDIPRQTSLQLATVPWVSIKYSAAQRLLRSMHDFEAQKSLAQVDSPGDSLLSALYLRLRILDESGYPASPSSISKIGTSSMKIILGSVAGGVALVIL
ncbi:hypothetical protein H4R33_003633, partial [Dimargaris cristalligena]